MFTGTETRLLILQAAYSAFGKYGFDGTSIKLIAREAGIAPGSIYNYFEDKEELFASAVKMGWEFFIDEFQKIGESHISLEKKFENIIDVGFDLLKKAQPLLKGMFFGANQRRLVQDNIERLLDGWERILIEEQKKAGTSRVFTKKQRRSLIKYIVMGVLLAVALAPPEEIDQELATIKEEISWLIQEEDVE